MINEHDIHDMCHLDKLHEGDKFTVHGDTEKQVFKFKEANMDYIFCYDSFGKVYPFNHWTMVVKI
jgi:hypothetical protein